MSDQARAPSRPRRPFGRLRDMPIWSKLGVIMIVPTLATIVVGTSGLIGHIDTFGNADRTRIMASLMVHSGELVHHLQDERAAAVQVLGANEDDDEDAADQHAADYSQIQQHTDEAEVQYQTRRTALTDLPPSFRSLLNDIGGRLVDLPQLRNQVAAGELGLSEASRSYEELINSLVNLRDSSAQLSGETELGDRMRAAGAIARAKEFLSRQRVLGHETLIRDAFHPQLRRAFIGTQTGHDQALEQFDAVATDAELARLEQTLEGPDVRQSGSYQDYLDSLEDEELGTPPWDGQEWDQVMLAHAELLRDVEQHLDSEVVSEAIALRDAVTQRMIIETGVLLAVLLLAVLLAWAVARSMVRSLRELRQGALAVAEYGLPQAVARLRDPALSTQLSPTQVASQIAEPLPVHSRDEFGQVTEAFNAVHLEAVRTAAEQASLRSSVATMFVNLARRSQILVDRLISHLDRLERGEEDPDRLAELFQLDHLATRMRRNDENLLVLAGADSTRVQRQPAIIIDVLRAAQSEVEHYTRVDFGVIDRDIEISAHAVNDLVHLVAELLDNASAFSPPDTFVIVEARRVGDRVVLYVEDQGLGMSAEQLAEVNERLATPPQVDVAVSRMMGLVVVSRLSARHGVHVQLRPGAQRGTVAEVTIPSQVLVPRGPGPGQSEIDTTNGTPAPQAAEHAPLALEGSMGRDPGGPVSSPPGPPTGPTLPASPVSPAAVPPISVSGVPNGHASAYAEPAGDDEPVSVPPSSQTRRIPVWSDLTGANEHNGAEPQLGEPHAPLPRRQPGGSSAADDESPVIPRQRDAHDSSDSNQAAVGFDGQTASEAAGDPATSGASQPSSAPTPGLWPPMAAPPTTQWPQPTPEQPGVDQSGVEQSGSIPATVPDQTMELPIFRQLESAWFRTVRERPAQAAPAQASQEATADPAAEFAVIGTTGSTTGEAMMGDAAPSRLPDGQSPGVGETDSGDWRTMADDGWRAAATLTESLAADTTDAGLPKRRPMAQLVPGGVETAQSSPQRRSPEAVRGLLSAYHRGVQRGRTQGSTDDVSHSAQAGREQGT